MKSTVRIPKWIGIALAACSWLMAASCSPGESAGEVPDGSGGTEWLGADWDGRDDLASPSPVDLSVFGGDLFRDETVAGGMARGPVDLARAAVTYYTPGEAGPGEDLSGEAGAAPSPGPLVIVDAGPRGELPVEMARPSIHVMFSQPMVSLARLSDPLKEIPWFTMEPAVKGTFRWYGTRVLGFEPDGPLTDHPVYRVTIGTGARSLSGAVPEKSWSFAFHTEPVEAVNFWVGQDPDLYLGTEEIPPEQGRFMVLECSQPVDPVHMKQFLSVTVGGKTAGFTLSRPAWKGALASRTERAVLVSLDAAPPVQTSVRLTMPAGTSPRPGYPGSKADGVYSFSTLGPFRSVELASWAWALPASAHPESVPVFLEFSHPLNGAGIPGDWTVTVNGRKAKVTAAEAFGTTVRLGLAELSSSDTVTVRPPAGLKDQYGRTLSNPKEARTCVIPSPWPLADFPWGFHQLERQFAPLFIWEGRNLDWAWLSREKSAGYGFDAGDHHVNARAEKEDIAAWKPDRTNYRLVDMKDQLDSSGFGTVYFNWAAGWTRDDEEDSRKGAFAIQVTDLGITTRQAWNRILVWVNSLSTGKAVAGAKVRLAGLDGTVREAVTGDDGMASFPLQAGEFRRSFNQNRYSYQARLTVTRDKDRCDLELGDTHNSWNSTTFGHAGPSRVEEEHARVFLFTDRGLYKPGEELAFRGIHWTQALQGFRPWTGAYRVVLRDASDDAELWETTGTASMSGGFAHRFTLPDDLEPGEYSLRYEADVPGEDNVRQSLSFTVARFRRLNFALETTVPSRDFMAGDDISADVKASYLAGGSMPKASYRYYWTRKPMAWMPPGTRWKDMVFGPGAWEGEHTLDNGEGTLSGEGRAVVGSATRGQNVPGAVYDYVVETTVEDVDRQAIASTAHVTVHPASFAIGARLGSGSASGWWSRFVSTGQDVNAGIALAGIDGSVWTAPAKVDAVIIQGTWMRTPQQGVYGRVNERWEYVEKEISRTTLGISGGTGSHSFRVKESGDYLLALEAKDAMGRTVRTVLRFYATGSDWVMRATESPSDIEMIPDRDVYLPGETARILVRSPVPEGRYLMTLEREGIREQKIITITGGQTLLEIPIKESHVPVIYVALAGFTKREGVPTDYFDPDLGRPRSLFGIAGLRVDTRPVELDVEVAALKGVYRPGEKAEVAVKVTREGKPVPKAEVTLMAVDRGVLDLISYHVPDPVEFFYDPWHFPLGVEGDDSRRLLMKPVTYDTSRLTGGDGEGEDKEKTRKDFRPLALFEPFVATDANGVAKVQFVLPDNLTTYRITALALRENRLGIAESELRASNPLNLRTALPRSWRLRDTAAAGVVIQNLTREEQEVTVTASSTVLQVGGDATRTVKVQAGSVYELPFVLSALREGSGTISFRVHSAALDETLEEKVRVERPLQPEAFTTAGFIDPSKDGASEGLVLPSRAAPGYGSLELGAGATLATLGSAAAQRLAEPVSPWDSPVTRVTRALGTLASGSGTEGLAAIANDLGTRQQDDGGIQAGSGNGHPSRSDPLLSVTSAWFLVEARGAGLTFARGPKLDRLLDWLSRTALSGKVDDPAWHAWTAWVLASAGRSDRRIPETAGAFGDRLGLGGMCLLSRAWKVMGEGAKSRALYDRARNFVTFGTRSVDLKETWEASSWWSSGVSELALLMMSALDQQESMDLVSSMARSLGASEGRHRRSSLDDLWTVLAFRDLRDREGPASAGTRLEVRTSDALLADLSLDGKSAVSLPFGGDALGRLPRDKNVDLNMGRKGSGPVYYWATLQYALPDETMKPRDEGIEVVTRWETLDGTATAPDKLVPGTTYRVRADVSTLRRRSHLELQVPIPSGTEIVDPGFVTTGRHADQGGTGGEVIHRETILGDSVDVIAEGEGGFGEDGWYMEWYRPDTLALDSLMVYRWDDFYAGSRSVDFLVRATTPGIYPVPPARAFLEYEPEVFGRDGGKLFVIKP